MQSDPTGASSDSINSDEENRLIEEALNDSDDATISQQPVSVFDLSPMLASGCAV
jgi:hypothetical protein